MREMPMRIAALCVIVTASGAVAQPVRAPGPCRQIAAACQDAGFSAGAAKSGEGLQVDCIRPIMQGIAQRRRATKPLPQIDPQLIEACKAANPNFGQGNQGNAPPSGSPPPAGNGAPTAPNNTPAGAADGPTALNSASPSPAVAKRVNIMFAAR